MSFVVEDVLETADAISRFGLRKWSEGYKQGKEYQNSEVLTYLEGRIAYYKNAKILISDNERSLILNALLDARKGLTGVIPS